MPPLFFARKKGLTVAHNLSEAEVYEMRLGDSRGEISIYKQHGFHDHAGMPAFCHLCAEQVADRIEKEKELFWARFGIILND